MFLLKEKTKKLNANLIISIVTIIFSLVVGVLLITGYFGGYMGNQMRIIFGIILILYGFYRLISIFYKQKQAKLEKEREKIKEAKDKLMNK